MQIGEFVFSQPIKGVPVIMVGFGQYKKYIGLAAPVKLEVVSDNESYAIYKGSKYGKLTVKTSGSGKVRTDPVVTFEEVSGL